MNIVFLGTPEISKQCLEILYNSKHKILAVVTNIDKPIGRGNKIQVSPVKQFALEKNIKVLQYQSVSKEGEDDIKALKPDALVLVAFGQILRKNILDIALPINLHGSLLPKYRGPSPIQTAILNGDKFTGPTTMIMEESLDSGDILLQDKIEIDEFETSGTLFEKMGDVGGNLLVKTLDLLEENNLPRQKQDNSLATFTTKLTKENANLDFENQSAFEIVNKVKAYNPSPVAVANLCDKPYKIYMAKVSKLDIKEKAGEVIFADRKNGIVVMAKDKPVEILTLQAQNGKVLNAKDFLNGNKILWKD